MAKKTTKHAYAEMLGQQLIARGWQVTTAESCTGGGIAKAITAISGSSAYFERGYVTYSNEAKVDMLGVSSDALTREGAVSEIVVRQMAEGALKHSSANIAVAVSGIAGPGGGSDEKPVGTVWIAWAMAGGEMITERFMFEGSRKAVRKQTINAALKGLINLTSSQ